MAQYDLSSNRYQKALKERGIDSMLEDARNDNKDTDTEHLRRKCERHGPRQTYECLEGSNSLKDLV